MTLPLQTRAALVYDFDGTLIPGNMQEYSYIPELGLSKDEFWREANGFADAYEADNILAYMYLMVKKARESDHVRYTRADLRKHGEDVRFFPGVRGWFDAIDDVARELNLDLQHYVISSGIKSIIEGTPIARHFAKIYASSFIYDEFDVPVWPSLSVNYTTKTQFLFRISKGAFQVSDDRGVNALVDSFDTPFRNMVFFGDGETDIPSMRLIKSHGGKAIAVYDPDSLKAADVASKLVRDRRANTKKPADYSVDGDLFKYVRDVLALIAADDRVTRRE